MKLRTRHIVLAAALGLVPALLAIGMLQLFDGPLSLHGALQYAAIIVGGMVVGIIVLWLLPALLFYLLQRLGVRHARVALFRGLTLLAVVVALAPVLALLLLAFEWGSGACSYPFSPVAESLCHQLKLAGTWGFALSVPAGGFIVLLGLLMLRLSAALHEDGVTVGERARREGLA